MKQDKTDLNQNDLIMASLVADEPGDARSQLDEYFPDGDFDIPILNEANAGYLWSWNESDGWIYTDAE